MIPSVRCFVLALPIALLLAMTACSSPGSPASGADNAGLPAVIAVPSGNTLAMTLKGAGLQNYECRPKTAGGGYDWALIGPEAVLRDKSDAIVGRHYAGPNWEYGDDSKVSGQVVADAPSPTPGNIPWLLLKGTPIRHPGALAGTTYVQRINTVGGVAPSDACGFPTSGTRKGVQYTADYLFYKP